MTTKGYLSATQKMKFCWCNLARATRLATSLLHVCSRQHTQISFHLWALQEV